MRTDRDWYLMDLAIRAGQQTTCIRAGVGCVLADHRGRVLAIAYNGVAAGQPHCNHAVGQKCLLLKPPSFEEAVGRAKAYAGNHPVYPNSIRVDGAMVHWKELPNTCEGWDLPPGEDQCEAVHAEQNALVQCPAPDLIHTAYVTRMPCPACTKLLLNTGCRRIVFLHPHNGKNGQELWQKAGREWCCLTPTPG